MSLNIYTNSISKEVIAEAEDKDLSWKYVITKVEEEGVLIEYWEINLDTKQWEMKFNFRIDTHCAKKVFEIGLELS